MEITPGLGPLAYGPSFKPCIYACTHTKKKLRRMACDLETDLHQACPVLKHTCSTVTFMYDSTTKSVRFLQSRYVWKEDGCNWQCRKTLKVCHAKVTRCCDLRCDTLLWLEMESFRSCVSMYACHECIRVNLMNVCMSTSWMHVCQPHECIRVKLINVYMSIS